MLDLVAALRRAQDRMLADLKDFVELESPSDDKQRTDRFADFLAEYAKEHLESRLQVIPQSELGSHLRIEVGPAGPTPPVLVLAHFDTVWPAGTLAEMPFGIDGDIARGPGIFDMKAGLVLGLYAVEELQKQDLLRGPVVFLCTSDEEIGSPTSRALIEAESSRSRAVLVLEPSEGGALKTSRKGVGFFRVEVTGRAAHAGLNPRDGVSAIEELSRLVLDLHAMTSLATGVTVNVGVIQGGTRPNVTAARATADVDLRVATLADADRSEAAILGLKSHNPNAGVRVSGGINRPPMERTRGVAALYSLAQSIGEEINLAVTETTVGGASDGNFVAALGIPVLDGLGAVGGGAHSLDEHVQVSSLPIRAALVARLLVEVQSRQQL